MKIKLSELRQLIKSVIKEQTAMDARYPKMNGATELFLQNGYEVIPPYSNNLVELKKDDTTVILRWANHLGFTIQINTGKPEPFKTISDIQRKTIALGLDPIQSPKD